MIASSASTALVNPDRVHRRTPRAKQQVHPNQWNPSRQLLIAGVGGKVRELIVDLFAGAGGASTGIEMATGRSPDVAVNHCPVAIATHERNHPSAKHYQTDVFEVNPREATMGQPVGLLWASPDCTHHSKAMHGKPRSDRVRSLAWVVRDWAREARPKLIAMENVEEFTSWGPLDPKGFPIPHLAGTTFKSFIDSLEKENYSVGWNTLVAADFGAPTTRERFFLVARRDGRAPKWPSPTHGPGTDRPYVNVSTCLDLHVPGDSLWAPGRDALAPNSNERIAVVLHRHVLGARNSPVANPAAIVKHNGGVYGHSIHQPLGTITCTDRHGLTTCTLADQPTEGTERVSRFMAEFGRPVTPFVETPNGRKWATDITYRMLQPNELALAQGLPPQYQLPKQKYKAGEMIGNSVVPQVAAAVITANLDALDSACLVSGNSI